VDKGPPPPSTPLIHVGIGLIILCGVGGGVFSAHGPPTMVGTLGTPTAPLITPSDFSFGLQVTKVFTSVVQGQLQHMSVK